MSPLRKIISLAPSSINQSILNVLSKPLDSPHGQGTFLHFRICEMNIINIVWAEN